MRQQIKNWTIRITVTGLFIATLLLVIVLNPILSYGNKTTARNYQVFHNKPLDSSLMRELEGAVDLLKKSELFNPNLKLDICLNDGSGYPKLMELLRGQAFAWGFYDKVVLQGTANYRGNYILLNGYKWNLTQLLAHEMTHCMQFDNLGFWRSKPFAKIPNWKWEGYAEYISRKDAEEGSLIRTIERYIKADKREWGITFSDGTIAPREYYEYWLLVGYCMDIRKMTYRNVLADTASQETIRKEMMDWFSDQD
jgi:hypothetical protein